jgi:transcriptional regulator with XRE-family HTH domain
MAIPGSNIRLLRQQEGLSMRALAKAIGIDVAALSRIESGAGGARQETLEKIAKVLNVSVGVLFAEPEKVEAAALRMRYVPILASRELVRWKGPDVAVYDDQQPFLHADLDKISRFGFALLASDDCNEPALRRGDRLIFDPKVQPSQGDFVVAVTPAERVIIGRLIVRKGEGGDRAFTVLPCDVRAHSAESAEGAELRGTLIEVRKTMKGG